MTSKRARSQRSRARSNNRLWIIGGLVVLAVVVVGGLIWANQSPPATPVTGTALTSCGKPSCGQANAPVTVDEYSDFQ